MLTNDEIDSLTFESLVKASGNAGLREKALSVHRHMAVNKGILAIWQEQPQTVGECVTQMLAVYNRHVIAGIHLVCGAALGMERPAFPAQWMNLIQSTLRLSAGKRGL